MSVKAEEFTKLDELDEERSKPIEVEIDAHLRSVIAAAKKKGETRLDTRYLFSESASCRVCHFLKAKYKKDGWKVDWTNNATLEGLWFRAEVQP